MTRIEIGFITNEEYDEDEEYKEFVVIKSISEDKYSFLYNAPRDDGSIYTKRTEYNKEQLLAWFRGAFRLGVIAIDSYKAFQFLFPIVPPFKIPPKKLDNEDQFDSLLDLFSEQLDFMENEGPTPSPSSEEEDEDEESGSSQEDPMPSPTVEEEEEETPSMPEVATPSVPEVSGPTPIVPEVSGPTPSVLEVSEPRPSVQEISGPRRSSRINRQAARSHSDVTAVLAI